MTTSPPQISLCLIVRDEADALPRFLQAAQGCWDELCAVDTGSTDQTVPLLEAAGARVTHRPWDDDFSAARNASLDLATGDWILILDPDELPEPGFASALRAAVADPQAGALLLSLRNLLSDGHHRDCRLLRAFRRDASVRFEHRIHEDAGRTVGAMLARRGLHLRPVPGRVLHEGYLRARAVGRDKRARDRRILTEAIAADPTDLYLRFKLLEQARFWSDGDLLRSTAAATVQDLAVDSELAAPLPQVPWGGELLTLLAEGTSDDPDDQLALLDGWAPAVAPGPALSLRRAELLEQLGRLDDAVIAYQLCLEMPSDGTPQRTTTRPLLGLVRVALLQGRLDDARALCASALRLSPEDGEARHAATALGVAL